MRLHGDFNRLRPPPVALQAHLLVDEAHEALHSIQDGLNLELNSGSPRWISFCLFNSD
jgi:hypothetical protein